MLLKLHLMYITSSIILNSYLSVHGKLENSLNYYETLQSSDITVRTITKRSTTSPVVKQVTYRAFSRNFHLILKNSRDFIHPDFSAVTLDGYGNEVPFIMNTNDFFVGFEKDDPQSHVNAYWEDGVLTTNIITKDDEYTIEPSWRHLPKSNNYTMIAYRASDIKPANGGANFCGAVHPPRVNGSSNEPHHYGHSDDVKYRYKRAVTTKTACNMLLVADHHFYQGAGASDVSKTSKYLAHQLQKVYHLYDKTVFGSFTKMSVSMKRIVIHTVPQAGTQLHYNSKKNSKWIPLDLLKLFSRSPYSEYCLAHLFTHQSFDAGVLGLAYIASPVRSALGGVCSSSWLDKGAVHYLNTGFSSSMNSYGNTLPSQQAYLVTAHEIGHNWGAEHDAGVDACIPATSDGGKYIMYPYAVTGRDSNNHFFSPCSIGFIQKVLDSKHDLCFSEKEESFCGNGFRDAGEECDVGSLQAGQLSDCCTSQCRLKPNAQCSPENDGCCSKGCLPAPQGKVCFESDLDDDSCLSDSKCDGQSAACPSRSFKVNDTPCGDSGKCYSGKCVSFCETLGKTSCTCDSAEDSCKWCCKGNDKTCRKEGSKLLTDGRPCLKGYCYKGVCKTTDKNLIVRLWDIIEKITGDSLVAFMRANIVGTVIVFSLIIWVPASITISCLDRRREKREKEARENRSRRATSALSPGEAPAFSLREVPSHRTRHTEL